MASSSSQRSSNAADEVAEIDPVIPDHPRLEPKADMDLPWEDFGESLSEHLAAFFADTEESLKKLQDENNRKPYSSSMPVRRNFGPPPRGRQGPSSSTRARGNHYNHPRNVWTSKSRSRLPFPPIPDIEEEAPPEPKAAPQPKPALPRQPVPLPVPVVPFDDFDYDTADEPENQPLTLEQIQNSDTFKRMCDMGFDQEQVVQVLQKGVGNITRAIECMIDFQPKQQ